MNKRNEGMRVSVPAGGNTGALAIRKMVMSPTMVLKTGQAPPPRSLASFP
ncbi:MAG: hypothetical protein ABI419_10045 [Ginsengibacter sp.]